MVPTKLKSGGGTRPPVPHRSTPVGGLDDVTFFGDVHGLAFLWVEVHEPV